MGYEVFAVSVGSGLLALAPVPGAEGDLHADVDAIAQWRATLVVSATEAEEMQTLGAGTLPEVLQDAAIRWAHFPIRDFGVPDANVQAQWASVSEQARQQLQAGGRVLVHCRGGCGRSGMLVLRLMIEAGMNAEEALQRLRAVRPCAVETDAQMVWATRRS
ncbi:protein phosphatase [Rhodobacteraceae bacterium R_SAG9]|nr:protein phosphatase [Rhodobacteraceae bacterium R_SAG9]